MLTLFRLCEKTASSIRHEVVANKCVAKMEAQKNMSWANEGDIIPTFVINQTRNATGIVRNDTISRPDDWQEGFFEGTVKEFFEKPFNGLSSLAGFNTPRI